MSNETRTPQQWAYTYYSNRERSLPPPPREWRNATVLSANNSLAEWVVLTRLLASAKEVGSLVRIAALGNASELWQHCPFYHQDDTFHGKPIPIIRQTNYYDCGPGNVIQQLHRLVGLRSIDAPRGCLVPSKQLVKGRVILHLAVKKWGHACQPRISEQTAKAIVAFAKAHRNLEFIEVGNQPVLPTSSSRIIRGASRNLTDLVDWASSAEYYIGIPSGVMHLAAAFQRKMIVLVSRIHPDDIALPRRKNFGNKLLAWLYPQAVHLSEIKDSLLVKSVSVDALTQSVQGAIYPSFQLTNQSD